MQRAKYDEHGMGNVYANEPRGDNMQTLERREKILEILTEKGSLSYKEILNEFSKIENPTNILSDLDTLVFFRFLQKAGDSRKLELSPETILEIRPETRKQMMDNSSRISVRLRRLQRDFPPWYRKLAILRILHDQPIDLEEIITAVVNQYPSVKWHPLLVEASLRILKKDKYVTERFKGYTITSKGKDLLKRNPFKQFLNLRQLKDEYTDHFRTYAILNLIKDYDMHDISSSKITRYLQSEYGLRGNKRRAIRNTLENMIFAGLLKVVGSTAKRQGHIYRLGPATESLFSMRTQNVEMAEYRAKYREKPSSYVWPDRLEVEYREKRSLYERFCSELAKQLEELLSQARTAIAIPVESRVKSWESILDKCERNRIMPQKLDEIADLAGIRIVLLFRKDLNMACETIENNFEILGKEDTQKRLAENQFGYGSVHYDLRPPQSWFSVPTLSTLKGLRAEVQVRTAAQHIWAATSHILQYKQESDVPVRLQRSINRVAALLEMVDSEFDRVLSERNKYIQEIEDIPEKRLNIDSLRRTLDNLFPPENRKNDEPYAELLAQLRYLGIVTTKQLRYIIYNHWDKIKDKEAFHVQASRKSLEESGEVTRTTKERTLRDVHFTHVELTRIALKEEFDERYYEYYL